MTRQLAEIEADLTAAADAIRRRAPAIGDAALADALEARHPRLIREFAAALTAAALARTRRDTEAAP